MMIPHEIMQKIGDCRLFIARHGETVFNAAARIQGEHVHTPLTIKGSIQAMQMGKALAAHIHNIENLALHASDTGRALQTLALISDEIGADWHQHIADNRLREIDMGQWGGEYYRNLKDSLRVDSETGLFATIAPDGESYSDIARRLIDWIAEQQFDRDMLIISHGMTSRVLRGLLLGLDNLPHFNAPAAPSLPQGTMVLVQSGREEVINIANGGAEIA
ncbi:hypothetical protein LPB140_06045 [Sphingorhabdus lutea]|uniref:Histidine phosphatase family protein n=1 Tax=Sphingorhabdus lutea TaxID=1913578 RepID=A0A1L3JEU5_9SPHN|nr:histidine phosphatase family protein [Sphingorhabdus lutea]APG63640.1 hypothetical protein LPB140_06045 [Sphingorhabdus lutea]